MNQNQDWRTKQQQGKEDLIVKVVVVVFIVVMVLVLVLALVLVLNLVVVVVWSFVLLVNDVKP